MQGELTRSIIYEIIPEFSVINPKVFLLMTDNFMVNFSALFGYATKLVNPEDATATVIDRLGFSNEEAKAIKFYSTYSFINLDDFTKGYAVVYTARTLIDSYHYSRDSACEMLKVLLQIQHQFLTVNFAASMDYYSKAYNTIIKTFDTKCLCLKDMNISGDDLIKLGFKGPSIGRELNDLLDAIIECEVENEHEALMEWASYDC